MPPGCTAATAQARSAGITHALGDTDELERTTNHVRRQLEPARFADAWAAGEVMSADQVVSGALLSSAADS